MEDPNVPRARASYLRTLTHQNPKFNTHVNKNKCEIYTTLFLNKDNERRAFVQNFSGASNLLLASLNLIFPFCDEEDHIFRGVKRKITLN